VEFEHLLAVLGRGGDVDVAFLANTNLISQAEDGGSETVGVEGEVVEAAVC